MSGKPFGDRWEIIRPIEEGGQAHIYLVKDLKTQDDNTYVLKRLKNAKRKERFEKEIEALRSIESPYIEKVIDFNIRTGKDFYYVMPYYTEKTLESILNSLSGDFIRSFKIFIKICKGVQNAHTNKTPIIHRDLKPSNILINENDEPRIIDFGLCYLDDKERNTFSQEQVGSRFYIPPECEIGRSESIGCHTDIYSLGKILYAMISQGGTFPREKQDEHRFNLREILGDKRVKYIMQIINSCVKDKIGERLKNISDLLPIVEENLSLIEDGFFPVNYGDEFCRFCGKGKLEEFGQLKGAILKRGSLADDIVRYNMKLWGCPKCGIVFLFKDDLYKEHKS